MPVPDFQTMMLPTLEALADQQPHSFREIGDFVAKALNVTDDERTELLPSGRQTRFVNRIYWVKVHLGFAKLVMSPARGQVQIIARGLEVLATKPKRVDLKFLSQFPEYLEARNAKREGPKATTDEADKEEQASPLETVERSMSDLRQALVAEVLEAIKGRSPQFFEFLVLELMQRLGYGNFIGESGEHLGKGGDRGIDGVIREDKLGLDVIYLQAKRWDGAVGPATVREFLGALDQAGAKKGVLITTSTFTKEARMPFSKSDKKISLIDGRTLAELMIDHDLGVTPVRTFQVKRLDSDYFEED